MQVTLTAPDIECDGCAASIRKALGGTNGIRSIDVDVPAKTVRVDFDPATVEEAQIAALLDDIGFPVNR